MNDVIDIPIISRGRIIMPIGDDVVEFRGRGGAHFRSPDPHRHIHDLVLGNTALLADLNDAKMANIIDFLAEVGKRLHLDDNSVCNNHSRWRSRRAAWPNRSCAVYTTACRTCSIARA